MRCGRLQVFSASTWSHLKVFSALDALLDRGAPAGGLREASRLARDADVFSHASDLAAKNGRASQIYGTDATNRRMVFAGGQWLLTLRSGESIIVGWTGWTLYARRPLLHRHYKQPSKSPSEKPTQSRSLCNW